MTNNLLSMMFFEDDQEYDPAREDALMIHEVFRNKSISLIYSTSPGIQSTSETEELTIQLQTYLMVNDSSFKDLPSLFYIHTLQELIIEEENLEKEFHFFNVPSARKLFKTLVLSSMKKETKELCVDLKPL